VRKSVVERVTAETQIRVDLHLDGTGRFDPDFADEIVTGACVTHDHQIRHEPTREALEGRAPEAVPTERAPQ